MRRAFISASVPAQIDALQSKITIRRESFPKWKIWLGTRGRRIRRKTPLSYSIRAVRTQWWQDEEIFAFPTKEEIGHQADRFLSKRRIFCVGCSLQSIQVHMKKFTLNYKDPAFSPSKDSQGHQIAPQILRSPTIQILLTLSRLTLLSEPPIRKRRTLSIIPMAIEDFLSGNTSKEIQYAVRRNTYRCQNPEDHPMRPSVSRL